MVIQVDIECGQKGVQVCIHTLIMDAFAMPRPAHITPINDLDRVFEPHTEPSPAVIRCLHVREPWVPGPWS